MAIIDGVNVSGTVYGLRDNDTSGGIAPTFSTSTAYTAGQYVWYDSGSGAKLYRFTADHDAGVWTGMDATEIKLGNDVSALKSALGTQPDDVPIITKRTWKSTHGYYYKTGHTNQYQWFNSDGFETTEKIEIDDETKVYVFSCINSGVASLIQFWDNSQIIGDYAPGSSTEPSLYETSIPSGTKYISYTSNENRAGGSYIVLDKDAVTAFGEISNIELLSASDQIVNVKLISDGAFYRDGSIEQTSSYKLSDYVPCVEGDSFDVELYGCNINYYLVAYYDSSKNLLYFDKRGTGYTDGVFQTISFEISANNIKYVRFTVRMGAINCVRKSLSRSANPLVIQLNKQSLDDSLGAGINKGRFESASKPDSFMLLHFSDIHGTGYNLSDISEVRKYLADVLDDTLCTGDIMESNWSNSFDFWDSNSDGTILTCIGNHDVKASNAGGDGYLTNQQSEADLYGRYMEDYISGWNVVHSDTNLYYYKDYAAKKIRLIVLNLLYPTAEKVTEQNTWLATVLAGAKTAGYGVVIGEHYYPVSGTKISCTFSAEVNSPTSMSNPGNYMYNGDALTTYQATVQSFIDGGGNFVCWLCGHKHADYIVYHPDYPKQVFIGVGGALFTEKSNETNHTSDMRRVKNTKSQNCMNVLSIDPAGKVIKVIRIGCDRDFLSRHRGVLVLDYSTNPATVVYND